MKTILAFIFTLVVSISIPGPVVAVEKPRSKPVLLATGGFSLTPTIAGYVVSESEKRDITQLYGLKLGYDLSGKSLADSLGIEATFNYFSTKPKAAVRDTSGYLVRLDAIYPFNMGTKWVPFLALGGGAIATDTTPRLKTYPLFNYGAGLKYFLDVSLAVRFDARHHLIYDNINTRNNFEFGIGMSYYFGKEGK